MKKYNTGQKLLLRRIKKLKARDEDKAVVVKIAEVIFEKINKK